MAAERRLLDIAVSGASITREVVVESGALSALPAVAQRHLPAGPRLLVVDRNTRAAAGEAARARLEAADNGPVELLELPGTPRVKADAALVDPIVDRASALGGGLIAIGSGVINDLVKHAAALRRAPYVCVATAASMDGYAASGAALHDRGFKRTFPCPPPVAIVADLDVIATAPAAMAAWGYGDLAGKLVAGADWRLADALDEEPINSGPFGLVQDNVRTWLSDPASAAAGGRPGLGHLMDGLLISGFAMQAHGNSRPASGSDHQFAHLWEMEGREIDGLPAAHGACVGIGCVSMLALYDWLLAQSLDRLDVDSVLARLPIAETLRRQVDSAFPDARLAESAWQETTAKRGAPGQVQHRLQRLRAVWPDLRQRLRRDLPTADAMRRRLDAAGAPTEPALLGIDRAQHARDYLRARLIRRRYTLLDLLADLGWLETAVDALFAPGGFWAAAASEAARTRAG